MDKQQGLIEIIIIAAIALALTGGGVYYFIRNNSGSLVPYEERPNQEDTELSLDTKTSQNVATTSPTAGTPATKKQNLTEYFALFSEDQSDAQSEIDFWNQQEWRLEWDEVSPALRVDLSTPNGLALFVFRPKPAIPFPRWSTKDVCMGEADKQVAYAQANGSCFLSSVLFTPDNEQVAPYFSSLPGVIDVPRSSCAPDYSLDMADNMTKKCALKLVTDAIKKSIDADTPASVKNELMAATVTIKPLTIRYQVYKSEEASVTAIVDESGGFLGLVFISPIL